jgi:uncharacterized protein (TIGR02145 family)
MHKKRYIFFGLIVSFCLTIVAWQYFKTFDAAFALATNSGHSWNQMECTSTICVDSTNNRIGMGDSSPEATLHVEGGFKVGDNTICDSSTGAWTFSRPLTTLEPTEDNHIATKKYTDDLLTSANNALKCREGVFDSRDGNWYPGILIGNQCWMAKNLKYLPSVVGPGTRSKTVPYYYVYGYGGLYVSIAKTYIHSPFFVASYDIFGVLYNYPAAKSACPSGWHLPTDLEFQELENFLDMSEVDIVKTGWRGAPVGTLLKKNGSSKFSALFAGFLDTDGKFYSGDGLEVSYGDAFFWSSSFLVDSAWIRSLSSNYSTVYRNRIDKEKGFSVRCLRD